MITKKLTEIENLISEEIAEFNDLSNLYDEKKETLIKSKMDSLITIDNKIQEKALTIRNLEEKRKNVNEELGISINASISDYIELAHKNALSLENKLTSHKKELANLNKTIATKEKTNTELIKHGLKTVNKLIKIIVNSATKSTQYNNYGKNTKDEHIEISSIEEEV